MEYLTMPHFLGTTDPAIEWEDFKTTLRGTFMAITCTLRKNAQQHSKKLEQAMLVAESAYARDPSPTALNTWWHNRREYELHLLDLTK